MRILIINYEYPPLGGGSSTATAEMAAWAARAGHNVAVLTARFAHLPRQQHVDGYTVTRIPAIRLCTYKCTVPEMLSFIASAIPQSLSLTSRFKPNIVWAVNGIPSGPPALALKKLRGIPYLLLLRDGEVPGFLREKLALYHRFAMPLTRSLWRNAAAVTTNSEGLRELALRTTPDLDIHVVPNAVDTEKFHPSHLPPDKGYLQVVFLGRLSPQKGVEHLLHALARLPHEVMSRVRLKIYGDGPERTALVRLTNDLALWRFVSFGGWVKRRDVPEVLRSANIYVLPSLYEGMPNALLEAMSTGLAVIATNVAGSQELIRDGKNGVLVPPRDPQALQDALLRLLESEKLRQRLAKAARESVVRNLSWEAVTQQYLDLSQSAVA